MGGGWVGWGGVGGGGGGGGARYPYFHHLVIFPCMPRDNVRPITCHPKSNVSTRPSWLTSQSCSEATCCSHRVNGPSSSWPSSPAMPAVVDPSFRSAVYLRTATLTKAAPGEGGLVVVWSAGTNSAALSHTISHEATKIPYTRWPRFLSWPACLPACLPPLSLSLSISQSYFHLTVAACVRRYWNRQSSSSS